MSGENVLVVPRTRLFHGEEPFEGFKFLEGHGLLHGICADAVWMPQDLAETDEDYKQLIPIALAVDWEMKKAFCYQRAADDASYQEKRLQMLFSLTIGGHIKQSDALVQSSAHPEDVAWNGLMRELQEEVAVTNTSDTIDSLTGFLALINSELTPVDRVHIGVLALMVLPRGATIKMRDPEIAFGAWRSIFDIQHRLSSLDFAVETWARIAFQALQEVRRQDPIHFPSRS